MNDTQTWRTVTASPAQTGHLAETVGKRLRGGEVIELVSDLGGGKTTFVQGLAKGMGSPDNVASPTFTISRRYSSGKLTLHHFDFYRLHEPGIMADELAEVIGSPDEAVVVEWADIVANVLPPERLTIRITATGETERQLVFSYPKTLAYLVPANT